MVKAQGVPSSIVMRTSTEYKHASYSLSLESIGSQELQYADTPPTPVSAGAGFVHRVRAGIGRTPRGHLLSRRVSVRSPKTRDRRGRPAYPFPAPAVLRRK